jgi:hypothetical protein
MRIISLLFRVPGAAAVKKANVKVPFLNMNGKDNLMHIQYKQKEERWNACIVPTTLAPCRYWLKFKFPGQQ